MHEPRQRRCPRPEAPDRRRRPAAGADCAGQRLGRLWSSLRDGQLITAELCLLWGCSSSSQAARTPERAHGPKEGCRVRSGQVAGRPTRQIGPSGYIRTACLRGDPALATHSLVAQGSSSTLRPGAAEHPTHGGQVLRRPGRPPPPACALRCRWTESRRPCLQRRTGGAGSTAWWTGGSSPAAARR